MSSGSVASSLHRAILNSTISDAYSDGKLDAKERKKIAEEAKRAGVSAEELKSALDVNWNLAQARMAVDNVRGQVVAGNWRDADSKTKQCVKVLREEFEEESAVDMLLRIERLAKFARKHGCGNCGEQSAVAFMYLYQMKIRPLDRMSLGPKVKGNGVDHAFVVIGRAGTKTGKLTDWDKWGPKAVVCDPWGAGYNGSEYGAYTVDLFETRMKAMMPRFEWAYCHHREA